MIEQSLDGSSWNGRTAAGRIKRNLCQNTELTLFASIQIDRQIRHLWQDADDSDQHAVRRATEPHRVRDDLLEEAQPAAAG